MPAPAIIHQLNAKFNENRASGTPQEHEQLRREIDSTDRHFDALVYQLYSLTDEEIRIVRVVLRWGTARDLSIPERSKRYAVPH